jgi:hypothetical protein
VLLIINWQATVHTRLVSATVECSAGAWPGLRPAGAGCACREREDLPGRLRRLGSAAGLGDDEQARALPPAERAGERAAIEYDGGQHLPALAHPHAAPVSHVGVPDRALGVEGGLRWRVMPTPADAQTVCFSGPQDGWLGAGGRLYRSTHGGRSWALVTAGLEPASAGYPATMIVQCAAPAQPGRWMSAWVPP